MAKYAVSDIHGNGAVWNNIKKFLKEDDILYILGDCADRGKEGWRIICEAIEMPNIVYLMGNHEQMLYDALNEFRTTHGESRIDREILFCNGGRPTFHDAMRHFNHSMVNKIGLLPYWKTYTNKNGKNIILTHAGFTPKVKDEYPEKEILIWSRLHFTNRWREGFEDTIIVHGHTPCEYLIDDISMDWAFGALVL